MPANLSADYGKKFIETVRALSLSAVALCGAMGLEGADREAAPKALTFGKEQVLVEAKFFEVAANSPAVQAVLPWVKNTLGNVVEVFAAEQAAGLAAVLGATKGVDLLAAPSATTRSGQEVVIEIGREVRYPIGWKKDAQTGGWEPSDYATKRVGITLGVLAKVQGADAIELTLRPEIVKLAGFHDLDAIEVPPKIPGIPGLESIPPGLPIPPPPAPVDPSEEQMLKFYSADAAPVGRRARAHFAVRKIEKVITLRFGESVLLELGTPPVREVAKRRNFVLATVKVVKPERGPAGVEIEAVDAAVVAPDVKAQSKPIAPAVGKSAMMEKAEKVVFPAVEFAEATVREIVEMVFRNQGCEAGPSLARRHGVNIVLNLPKADTTRITMSFENTSLAETLKYIADQAGLEIEAGEEGILLRPPEAEARAMPEPAAGTPEAQLLARARSIVIPTLRWKDATVAEGVQYLHKKSAELDPEKKAVNILVMPSHSGPGDLVTLDLTNVSLAGALGYVAQLAGLRLEVTATAFVLRPPADKE